MCIGIFAFIFLFFFKKLKLQDRRIACFRIPFLRPCLRKHHFFLQTYQVVERVDMSHEHPLALLAEELKKLLKKDSATFMPILSQRHPQATFVSASLVHKLYGHKLVSVHMICLFFS